MVCLQVIHDLPYNHKNLIIASCPFPILPTIVFKPSALKKFKCKARNYKALRGKHRQYPFDINHRKILSDPPPSHGNKNNKWGLIKLKSFAQQRKL